MNGDVPDNEETRLAKLLPEKYQVLETLGSGGMGVVFHAINTELDVHVAVKVIRPRFVHEGVWLERFKQEARILMTLRHPLCVTLLDYGLLKGEIPYLTMDYCRGRTLKALIDAEAPLPARRSATIAMQVLEVLEAAHKLQIIHRDIKPENIMVDESGREDRIKVMDFGIAKLLDQDVALTVSLPVGTPLYMSPERILNAPNVDGRADIYSVGAILHEMLAGEPPFHGRGIRAVMAQHLRARVPALRSGDTLTLSLHRLARRAMRKKPEQRFPDAQTFREAIADALEQAGADLGGTWPRVPQPTRSGPAILAGMGIVAVLSSAYLFITRVDGDSGCAPANHATQPPGPGTPALVHGVGGPPPTIDARPSDTPSILQTAPPATPSPVSVSTYRVNLAQDNRSLYPRHLDRLYVRTRSVRLVGPGPGVDNDVRLDGVSLGHTGPRVNALIDLSEGPHRITLVGRNGRAYQSRELHVVADRTPPVFLKVRTKHLDDGRVRLEGSVEDSDLVRVTLDGTPVHVVEAPNTGQASDKVRGDFSIDLRPDQRQVELEATDLAGNSSRQTVVVGM